MNSFLTVRRIAICVAGLVAMSLLAACGGDDNSDAPKKVDRLVFAVPAPTQEAMNPNRDMQPQDEFQHKANVREPDRRRP